MTVTLTHRTDVQVVKRGVVKIEQDADYITLYFDKNVYPTMRYVKLPVTAYGNEVYRITKVTV